MGLSFFGRLTQQNTLALISLILGIIYSLLTFINRKQLAFNKENIKKNLRLCFNGYYMILYLIFVVSLYWRLFYVSRCYPLFTGYDTVLYVSDTALHMSEFPNYTESGIPFSHSLFYMLAAIFFSLSQNAHSVPVFVSVVDSFSIFGTYLLYGYISKSKKIAVLGALMYSLSFFAFRFFSDLYKEVLVNMFIPIGLYLVFKGYDKGSVHDVAIAGLIFGFSILTHTDSLYRILLYLFTFTLAIFVSQKRREPWLVKFFFAISLTALILLCVYQTYLYISGANYTLIDRFFAAFKIPLKPSLGQRGLVYAIPYSSLFLSDFLPLLFGNLFLIIKDVRNGIWWSLSSYILLFLSLLPFIGIYIPASIRIFYYYGFFSYLSKATFLLFITDICWRMLTKSGKVIIFITMKLRKIAFNCVYAIIIAVLLFDCFVAPIDIFSFYPIKKQMSHVKVFHQSAIGQVVITQNQYEKLTWLKSHIEEGDYVITTYCLQNYASYILSINRSREIMYNLRSLENQSDWTAAYNLVSGDLFEGVKYFQDKNTSSVYIALDLRDATSRELASKSRFNSLFEKVVYDRDIAIFRVDIKKLATDFQKIVSNARVNVRMGEKTYIAPLSYSGFESFPHFSLSLTAVTECNITEIPKFLVFKSISPSPKKFIEDTNNYIYFQGVRGENYTVEFMAIYPYISVGWKDDSFLQWNRTRGVTLESNGSICSVYVKKLYGGIYLAMNLNVSIYKYLILRHKVSQGCMEIYLIKPDGSKSVLVSGNRDWSISVVDLQAQGVKGNITGIKIQGNKVPTQFDLDFILFAHDSP